MTELFHEALQHKIVARPSEATQGRGPVRHVIDQVLDEPLFGKRVDRVERAVHFPMPVEVRLRGQGPDGIRLQMIGQELGRTRPARPQSRAPRCVPLMASAE